MADPKKAATAGVSKRPTNLVKTLTGFPPYWDPAPGRSFYAKVIGLDMRDLDFMRYILIAGEDTDCATGKAADATPVTVKEGERFSCSVYARLPLDKFAGEFVVATAVKKADGKNGTWEFTIESTEEVQKLAASRESVFIWPGGGKPALLSALPAHLTGKVTGNLPEHMEQAAS